MLTSVRADPMSPASDIKERIAARQRLASFEQELIARSRDLVAASKALLAEPCPTTFLGAKTHSLWPKDPLP